MTTSSTPPSTGDMSAGDTSSGDAVAGQSNRSARQAGVVSMTGFARIEGGNDSLSWIWEARSVNGRGLDIRIRYPQGLDVLDGIVRKQASARFRRGSVSVTLTLRRPDGATGYTVNQALLDQLVQAVLRRTPYDTVSIETLMGVRGVVEQADDSAAVLNADDHAAIEADLARALDALAAARTAEGDRLSPVLAGQVADLRTLTRDAAATAELQPAHIQEKLQAALADLLGTGTGTGLDGEGSATAGGPTAGSDRLSPERLSPERLNPDRLAQEIALLASKADIREELDRLSAHLDQAEELLAAAIPVGRQLDFLCQELNREANTLCSKAAAVPLTRIGMAMKAAIEQFREQVQNVE